MRPQRGAGRLRSLDLSRPTLRNPLADEKSGSLRACRDALIRRLLTLGGWTKKLESRRASVHNLTRPPGPHTVGRCPKPDIERPARCAPET